MKGKDGRESKRKRREGKKGPGEGRRVLGSPKAISDRGEYNNTRVTLLPEREVERERGKERKRGGKIEK